MARAGKHRGFIRSIFQTVCRDYLMFASVDHHLWETRTFGVNRHSTAEGKDDQFTHCNLMRTFCSVLRTTPSASICAIGHAVNVSLLECCTGAAAPSLLLAEGAGSRAQWLPWSRPICALVCTPEYTEMHFLQCCCSWMRLASSGRRSSSQNSHVWVEANPHAASVHCHQKHFCTQCLGRHCAWLIGLYSLPWQFSAQIDCVFLEEKLPEMLEDIPLALRRNMVPAWWGCGSLCTSPPWSLDLTSVDFFQWGHIKALSYMSPVDSEVLIACFIKAAATWHF